MANAEHTAAQPGRCQGVWRVWRGGGQSPLHAHPLSLGHPQSILGQGNTPPTHTSCPCHSILTTPKGDRSQNPSESGGPLARRRAVMREAGHGSHGSAAAPRSPPLHIVSQPAAAGPRAPTHTHWGTHTH